MPQTLLALLALALAGLLMFNQQRAAVYTQDDMLDHELELMAGSVAMHVMEFVNAKSFDQRTTPANIQALGMPTGTGDFSPTGDFGSGGTCNLDEPWRAAGCDDLDDVDGIAWQPVPFRLRDGQEMPFEVSTEVFYVSNANLELPVVTPTNYKRVIVRVRSPWQVDRGRYTDGLVTLERVFSYDDKKAYRVALARYGSLPFNAP